MITFSFILGWLCIMCLLLILLGFDRSLDEIACDPEYISGYSLGWWFAMAAITACTFYAVGVTA